MAQRYAKMAENPQVGGKMARNAPKHPQLMDE
jgi:hypothetical protein